MSGYRFKIRRGTTAQWDTANPVLLEGEPGVDTTLDRMKVGDGSSTWTDLPYIDSAGLAEKADAADVAAQLQTKANASSVGALSTRVDTTETRVGTVEDEIGGRLSEPVLGSTFARKIKGNRVAAIGDSITGPVGPATTRGTPKSWFDQMCYLSGGRLQRVTNGGHSGWTTTMLLATYQSEIIAAAPDYCFDLSGTNDITLGDGVAVAKANKATMWDAMIAAGIEPVLMLLTPRTVAYQSQVAELNQWIRDQGRARGLHVLDTRKPVIDPADGTLLPQYSADDLHPNAAGAKAIGQYVLDQFLPKIPAVPPMLTDSNNNPANMVQNALMLVDSNTDGVPDNFASGAVTGHSLVDGTPDGIIGNWAKMTRTDTTLALMYNWAAGAGWAIGERIRVGLRFKATTSDPAFGYSIYFAALGGATVHGVVTSSDPAEGYAHMELTIPAGTTSLQFRADVTAGTGTLQVGQLTVRNLDRAPAPYVPPVVVADTFNRANGALGTTTSGSKTWAQYGSSTLGVVSNAAGCTGGTGNTWAYIDGANANGTVQATLSASSLAATTAISGLATRVQDASNAIYVQLRETGSILHYTLTKRVAGATTNYTTAVTPAVGDVVKIVTNGTTVTVNVNGADILTQTITELATVTKHGLYFNGSDTVTRWDDFSFTPAA